MLDWVFGKIVKKKRKKPGIGTKPAYEEARGIADTGTVEERTKLAAHEDLEPEILYYFATDEAPEVRREVAQNVGTPLQADSILARDTDAQVRYELARKIGRMVPGLGRDENRQLVDMAIEVLEILARDELPRVRAIISEELKSATNIPKSIIQHLAEDLEDIVSVPVLEYSPLLNEQDLKQIVARGVHSLALGAIARRPDLTEPVVEVIVAEDDADAVRIVLENKVAKISEQTYDHISEKAKDHADWHSAMVFRDDLPVRTILRIASFVNAALMEALVKRNTEQESVVDELRKTVPERIERGDLVEGDDDYVPASERVKEDAAAGILDEERLSQAVAGAEHAYIRHGLAELSGLTHETVSKMLSAGSAKAITALAWRAGLSMSFAEEMQSKVGRLKPDQLVHAGAGGGYPLTDEDMDWYLESFFG
ncbi:MAG: DUF2336 domain-containing protein [Rhodospirillales bacterium]|nr:DUF2336 domain-containing protein [Rhodospirillales bacterium]